ncbi:universal stress protein [Paraburkholderia oxyphila]|uniref:universal stress protein n=1 Tax=Paraburkholderia oxyphila TaxID=614212 RepID=UPI000480A64D|nr:universal stress protein [Paraburkholderia oxyphila]
MSNIIVVAISPNPTDAFLASALDVARHCDARIVAVHIVDLMPCFLGADFDYGLIVGAMEEGGQTTLADAMRILESNGRGVEAQLLTSSLSGSTLGRQIAEVCEARGAARVLLGKRKASWWRFMNEDVAASVRQHTSTPVHIIGKARSAPTSQRPLPQAVPTGRSAPKPQP